MFMSSEKILEAVASIRSGRGEEFHANKNYEMTQTTNYDVCAICGGAWCKKCGCHFSPDDFKEISFEYLKTEIEKGYISIDYVDGEAASWPIGALILRIRNKNSPIVDIGYRKDTPCILLTDTGCKLDYEQRPTGGKLLIPKFLEINSYRTSKPVCYSKYSINTCSREWRTYQEILVELKQHFTGIDIACSI